MNKYIYLAAAALMLAACNNEEETTVPDGGVALEVNAAISGTTTRASGTQWAEGDRIGISTTSDTKTQYTNVAYRFDGASFTAEGSGIYFQDSEEVTFKAYYPYADNATYEGVSTSAENQTAAEQPNIDFLFASGATASRENPTANFTGDTAFKHRMSQVTLTFINGNDIELTNTLTAYTLGGLVMEGTFDTGTGVATATTGAAAADLTIALSGVTTTDGKYTAAPLILFPQTAGTVSLSVVVDGETYYATLTIPDGALQAGNNYTFPVTVSKTGLAVGSATIDDWTEVTGGDIEATM